MAKKKKKAKATKAGAKGKARSKKLSVKKRAVKDLDAGRARSVQGGITGNTRTLNFTDQSAMKIGALPGVADTFQKIT